MNLACTRLGVTMTQELLKPQLEAVRSLGRAQQQGSSSVTLCVSTWTLSSGAYQAFAFMGS